jgi:hypothetical protein
MWKHVEIALLQAEVLLTLLDASAVRFERTLLLEKAKIAEKTNTGKTKKLSSSAGGTVPSSLGLGVSANINSDDTSTEGKERSQERGETTERVLVACTPGDIWKIGLANIGDPRLRDGSTTRLYGRDYIPQDETLCVLKPVGDIDKYSFETTLRANLNQVKYRENSRDGYTQEPNRTLAKKLHALQGHAGFFRAKGQQYILLGSTGLLIEREDKDKRSSIVSDMATLGALSARPEFQIDTEVAQRLEWASDLSLAALARVVGKDPGTFFLGIELRGLRYTQADVLECRLREDQLIGAILLSASDMAAYSKANSAFLNADENAPKPHEELAAFLKPKLEAVNTLILDRMGSDVNGGVRTCHWGGAKVDHFGARALERVALI